MMFLKFIWAVVANPTVAIVVVLAVLAALIYGYLRGAPALMKILMDLRTWCVAAILILGLAVSDLKKENTDLHKRIDTAEQSMKAKDDTRKTLEKRQRQRDQRAAEDTRLDEVIDNAPPGQAVDNVLDEIDRLQKGQPPAPAAADPVDPVAGERVRTPDGAIVP